MNRSFFDNETLEVARRLIGYPLIYEGPDGIVSGIISETEAYTQEDPACHAYLGNKTKRNKPMFLAGGHIYIYHIYGLHYCLNIVTESKNRGCAVLIRSMIPLDGVELIKRNRPNVSQEQYCNGPGKLMQALGNPIQLNSEPCYGESAKLTITINRYMASDLEQHTRVGISKGTNLPWRFLTKQVRPYQCKASS